jgi:hypothetical protein
MAGFLFLIALGFGVYFVATNFKVSAKFVGAALFFLFLGIGTLIVILILTAYMFD